MTAGSLFARGNVSIFSCLEEKNLILEDNHSWTDDEDWSAIIGDGWEGAISTGNMESLSWILENGYEADGAMYFAINQDKADFVIWARQHGA